MQRIAIVFCLLIGTMSGARAHAQLDHASPAVGSSVRSPPKEVVLWFTQSLEPGFSKIEVRNANGARVDGGKAQVSQTIMRIPLKALSQGTYQVHWEALSVDTHRTEGTFSFHVGD